MRKGLLLLFFIITELSIAQNISLTEFSSGLIVPVEITNAGDSRLFVVEIGGSIKIINPDGAINPVNFLTLTTETILVAGDGGLLGLAFHPDYINNGFFYVNYARAGDGSTVIARYSVSATDSNIANPQSELILMTIPQPFQYHRGGTLKFGPDGYLYIGMGDGGSIDDSANTAQNVNDNLGKMLRIDVNTTDGSPYRIPVDNPYVGIEGNDEIWAIGLRNPWKFSFDYTSNELWIADVGQSATEEINRVSTSAAGLNYGWNCFEGNNIYFADCVNQNLIYTVPFAQYPHNDNQCSIIGGYVYHGNSFPAFQDKYFFADYCVNRVAMLELDTGIITYSADFPFNMFITTFGEDYLGELYVAAPGNGVIYKIVDESLAIQEMNRSLFNFFPNPASNEIFIKGPKTEFPAKISIFDITGTALLKTEVDSETTKIDVSELKSGVYLINTISNSKTVACSKLIIK